MLNRYTNAIGGVILVAVTPLIANAQSPEERSLVPFQKCKTIENDIERLACFDSTLVLAQELAVEARDQRRERTKEDFGFSSLQIDRRDTEDAETDSALVKARKEERAELEPNEIVSKLQDSFASSSSKRQLFVLANGQIWQETSTPRSRRPPRINSGVTVSRSGFGGFRMRFEGKNYVLQVKRVK